MLDLAERLRQEQEARRLAAWAEAWELELDDMGLTPGERAEALALREEMMSWPLRQVQAEDHRLDGMMQFHHYPDPAEYRRDWIRFHVAWGVRFQREGSSPSAAAWGVRPAPSCPMPGAGRLVGKIGHD